MAVRPSWLRRRRSFRLPLNRAGVIVIALLPLTILVTVFVLSFRDGGYGLPAVIGAGIAIALGPFAYRLASWRRRMAGEMRSR